jgi:hypothetical protein
MNTQQRGTHPVVRTLAKDLSQQEAMFVQGGAGGGFVPPATGHLPGHGGESPFPPGQVHTMFISVVGTIVNSNPAAGGHLGFDGDGI